MASSITAGANGDPVALTAADVVMPLFHRLKVSAVQGFSRLGAAGALTRSPSGLVPSSDRTGHDGALDASCGDGDGGR